VPPKREAASFNQSFAHANYYAMCEITLAEREVKQWKDPLHAWIWDDHI
jgi:hypothetical protein